MMLRCERVLDSIRFLLITLAGWMGHHQQHAIAYLVEENRVLREQIGHRRTQFTDNQRRRLAPKPKYRWAKLLRACRDRMPLSVFVLRDDHSKIRRLSIRT